MYAVASSSRREKGIATAGLALVFSFVMVITSVAVLAGSGSSTPVGTMSTATAYGGRAYGASTHIPLIGDAIYSDTGWLPPDGGVLFGDPALVNNPVASATVFLTYTRGFMDVGRSEVATSDIALLPGDPYQVLASFAYVGTTATCAGASGTSEIPDLSVAGVNVPVTGVPNQIYQIPGVLTLVINEQIDQSSGSTYDMTVNALHLYTVSGVEAVVSSARSIVTCSPSSTATLGTVSTLGTTDGVSPLWGGPANDFMTGGGYFFAGPGKADDFGPSTCPGDRVNFGFNAGPRPGDPTHTPKGHINVVDHGDNVPCPVRHVEGTNVLTYDFVLDDTQHCRFFTGDATVDGVSGFHYEAGACDYGEPGRNDRFAIRVTDSLGNTVYVADNFDGTPSPEGGNLPGGNVQLHTFA